MNFLWLMAAFRRLKTEQLYVEGPIVKKNLSAIYLDRTKWNEMLKLMFFFSSESFGLLGLKISLWLRVNVKNGF